jgi:hypothetical protein
MTADEARKMADASRARREKNPVAAPLAMILKKIRIGARLGEFQLSIPHHPFDMEGEWIADDVIVKLEEMGYRIVECGGYNSSDTGEYIDEFRVISW